MGCNNSKGRLDDSTRSYGELDKIRVDISSIVLIVGDNRIKIATSCVLNQMKKDNNRELSINICTSSPNNAQMTILKKDGIHVYAGEMIDTSSITKVIKKCNPDTIFIVIPSSYNRVNETITLMQQCKRSGIGHVILLSNTIIERSQSSIFGEHYIQIERFLVTSGLSYTILRIPMYMDNYLSQLDSIASYGIFYQPLTPFCDYSSIAIIDVAEAVAKILLNPGNYSDTIITLNGPLACGNSAAEAFSMALRKTVTYEQISYESFKDCLLMSKMHEWQVNGMIELFKTYEDNHNITESNTLQDLLGRPPTDVLALAKAAVAETGLSIVSSRGYAFNANLSATKYSPQFNQGPSGCMGILTVTMILIKTQKLKSSLKSSSGNLDSPTARLNKSKKKGVRFVSEETDLNSELHNADKRFSFTDSDIANSPTSTMQSENPFKEIDTISNDTKDENFTLNDTSESNELDVPVNEKFKKLKNFDVNIAPIYSVENPNDISNNKDISYGRIRERFNSIDSNDTGTSLDSPKIIFGKNNYNFGHDEEEDVSDQLDNTVTLHLKSKFVILLEGNFTFIPVHSYISSMTTGSSPLSTPPSGKKSVVSVLPSPVSSPSSSKKQMFGSTPQMSLGKTLGRKTVDHNLGILNSNLNIEGANKPPSPISTSSKAIMSPQNTTALKEDRSSVARTIGSVENKSFTLRGYTVRTDPQNPLRIIVNGLKYWGKLFFLETTNDDDHDRWMKCIASHIEFEDNKVDNENVGFLI